MLKVYRQCDFCFAVATAAILAAAVCRSAPSSGPSLPWQPVSPLARYKLDVAEPILAGFRRMPDLCNDWEVGDHDDKTDAAANAIQHSLALSPSARAHRDVGIFYLKQFSFELALQHLSQSDSHRWDVRLGIRQADHGLQMERLAKRNLTPGYTVERAFGMTAGGRKLWVVLSSKQGGKETLDYPDRVRILVLDDRADRINVVWRSPVIRSIEGRGYFSRDLWPLRMTGGKTPELLFMGTCTGGSANPSITTVYRWNGKRFYKVLYCESPEQPMWVEDLNHNGHYQVRCVKLVGMNMSQGLRSLEPGQSLAQLLAAKRGVRNPHDVPNFSVEQVMRWVDIYRRKLGRWPTCKDGAIDNAPDESWNSIERALNRGSRGLGITGCKSFATFLDKYYGRKS